MRGRARSTRQCRLTEEGGDSDDDTNWPVFTEADRRTPARRGVRRRAAAGGGADDDQRDRAVPAGTRGDQRAQRRAAAVPRGAEERHGLRLRALAAAGHAGARAAGALGAAAERRAHGPGRPELLQRDDPGRQQQLPGLWRRREPGRPGVSPAELGSPRAGQADGDPERSAAGPGAAGPRAAGRHGVLQRARRARPADRARGRAGWRRSNSCSRPSASSKSAPRPSSTPTKRRRATTRSWRSSRWPSAP